MYQGVSKFFSRGGSIPTLHLKTFNIFFSGREFLKIYWSVGLTASMWHDGSSMQRDIFVKSGSGKNVFKTINSICLAHISSFGNAPSVLKLSLSSDEKKKQFSFANFLFNLKKYFQIFSGLGIFGKNAQTTCGRQTRLCRTCFLIGLLDGKIIFEYTRRFQNAHW